MNFIEKSYTYDSTTTSAVMVFSVKDWHDKAKIWKKAQAERLK